MADGKVTKMEKVDNRPRITPKEAAQRINRVVCLLSLLLESVFADSAEPDLREIYREIAEKNTKGSSGIRVSFLGLIEETICNSFSEIEETYVMIYPEELDGMACFSEMIEKVRSMPPCDASDYPDLSCSLYVPLIALAGLASSCNTNRCRIAEYSDAAFRGLGFVVQDARDVLVDCLNTIATHGKKVAA